MTKHIQNTKVILIGDLCLDIFFQVPNYLNRRRRAGAENGHSWVGLQPTLQLPWHTWHRTAPAHARRQRFMGSGHLASAAGRCGIRRIIQEAGESTGVTFLAVTPTRAHHVHYRGANTHLHPDEITSEALNGASLLHLSGYACLTGRIPTPSGKR